MRAVAYATMLGLLTLAPAVRAATIYVDVNGGGDYTTIQEGMNAAASGDTVVVANGTYYVTSAVSYGGKEVVLRAEFPLGAVIDCQGVTRAVAWNGEGEGAVLQGFVIQNGHTTGYGGALSCTGGAAPSIGTCVIRDCSAVRGGGLYIYESAPTVWDTGIRRCAATELGGGIYCYNSTDAEFTMVVVGENTAGDGGGMCIWAGSPLLQACTFFRNSGSGGGAMLVKGTSAPMLLRNIFAFSTAGKGISCIEGATPYVGYCDVYGNVGEDDICGTSIMNGNEDPRFCDVHGGDVWLCANSWCLPGGGNPGMTLIGAFGQGCGACDVPADRSTWGAVKGLYR